MFINFITIFSDRKDRNNFNSLERGTEEAMQIILPADCKEYSPNLAMQVWANGRKRLAIVQQNNPDIKKGCWRLVIFLVPTGTVNDPVHSGTHELFLELTAEDVAWLI